MSDLSGALCQGKWWLFDSTEIRDHLAAKQLCLECPVIAECRAVLQTCRSSQKGGGPIGTWAGLLHGKSGARVRDVDCGTEQGYQRHRYLGEERCAACKAAHRVLLDKRFGGVAS